MNMDPHHESEWIYSTTISKKLSPLNEFIHELPSVSHPVEIFLASCGYAFNPVMFPGWIILIYALTYNGLSSNNNNNNALEAASDRWSSELASLKPEHGAIVNTALYLASVLITLAFTEMGKASFASTRPSLPQEGYNNIHATTQWKRRYGKLVGSLKSKHSFPSGDSAQAMNLCMFLWRYVPVEEVMTNMGVASIPINALLFGIFVPGVAFARVFYRCHWIEDCIGGIFLSLVLHFALIPTISKLIVFELDPAISKWITRELAPWMKQYH